LEVTEAEKYCSKEVKKFDFYSYVAGQYMPKDLQKYYFGYHALFLEALKSREISRELSICQGRLQWWEQSLIEIGSDKVDSSRSTYKPREPIGVLLRSALDHTKINFSLIQRMVNFQLFDIDRGDIQTM
jgi:hypothetical protein